MAQRIPGLGPEAVQRIMHVVIEESLDAFENSPDSAAGGERPTDPER